MGLGNRISGNIIHQSAGTTDSLQYAQEKSVTKTLSSGAIAGALTEVLADKFPGQNVNMRVYMALEDRDTLFYTAIFSWNLPDFEHQWMPQNAHLANMLDNPKAGAVVMAQFTHWDVDFTELQGYMEAWQEESTRRKQQAIQKAQEGLQKIAQEQPLPGPRHPHQRDVILGPEWNAKDMYSGPARSADDPTLGRPKGVQPGKPSVGMAAEPTTDTNVGKQVGVKGILERGH